MSDATGDTKSELVLCTTYYTSYYVLLHTTATAPLSFVSAFYTLLYLLTMSILSNLITPKPPSSYPNQRFPDRSYYEIKSNFV